MKLNRSDARSAVLAVAAAVCAAPLLAQAQAPSRAEQAIKYRQAVFTLLGYNIGPISAMMKGEIPFDARQAELHATRLAQVAPMFVEGFPDGTQSGAPTKARAEIWSNTDDFRAKARDLETATQRLVEATRSGEQRQVGQALGGVGNACKACHDSYRAK